MQKKSFFIMFFGCFFVILLFFTNFFGKKEVTNESSEIVVDQLKNPHDDDARAYRLALQKSYVNKWAPLAQKEMREFGIPASITLAQGLIESNAGQSPLAINNLNHFGMKCFSKTCSKGHCSNAFDDHHKDFFRKYKDVDESYRSHSKLVTGGRYRNLIKFGNDYRLWAEGLQEAGYATDRRYAEKLIFVIEELGLYKYN